MLANAPQNASKSTTSLTLKSVKPALHLLPRPAAPSSQEEGYTVIRRIWEPGAGGCLRGAAGPPSREGRALTVELLDNKCFFQVMSVPAVFFSSMRDYGL